MHSIDGTKVGPMVLEESFWKYFHMYFRYTFLGLLFQYKFSTRKHKRSPTKPGTLLPYSLVTAQLS